MSKLVQLKGSEKQISWANDIRELVIEGAYAVLEERQEDYNNKNHKRRLRLLNEQKELVEQLENEESSKYFIDNFAYILKNVRDYEIESETREVSKDLIIGYEVSDVISRI